MAMRLRQLGRSPHQWAGTRSGEDPDPRLDDATLESRLIWLLGSPRSGSTWLLRLLVHPLALAGTPVGFAVPAGFEPPASAVVPLNEPYLPVHLTPLALPAHEPGKQPEPSEFLQNTRRQQDPSYFFSSEYEAVWRPEVRRLVLTRFDAQVARAEREHGLHEPLVAIKEPNGSHGAELLMSLFPHSRLLFLLRDGRDVVESMVDAHLPGGWLEAKAQGPRLDTENKRASFVLTQSRLWVQRTDAVSRAFANHDPERRLVLRYEELLTAPVEAMQRVFGWLGLERSEAEIREALERAKGGKRSATPRLWERTLSPREQEIMHGLMGPRLAELGYTD